MTRPYTPPGLGWILAIIVLILAILAGLGVVAIPDWILIALLALAILV